MPVIAEHILHHLNDLNVRRQDSAQKEKLSHCNCAVTNIGMNGRTDKKNSIRSAAFQHFSFIELSNRLQLFLVKLSMQNA